jgi:signal transduction histidine kinase
LRSRLLLLAAATTSLVVVAFLIPLAILVRNLAQTNALKDGLRDSQVVTQAVAFADEADITTALDSYNKVSTIRSAVLLPDGSWIGGAPPDTNSASEKLARGGNGKGSTQVTVHYAGGIEIWSPIGSSEGLLLVRTYVPPSLLNRNVTAALVLLVAVGVSMLAVAMLVADRLAQRTARPVVALAATANKLAAGEMGARATIEGPREVVAVGVALNRLAQRIGELLDDEREQVADLSHRLRTPVAAVRLAVEGLPKSPETTRLYEHVDALERSVGDVIREARRGVRATPPAASDVVSVVRERVAFWAVLAEDQGRRVELRLPAGTREVKVEPDELAAAVDALLENVFAHTPEGTAMAVAVDLVGDAARVTVSDEGPGMVGATHAVDRGRSGGGSTGLGLDIVRRTAESSGGRLEVGQSPTGGAAFTIWLGPCAPAV